jgi:hypothetical protein
VAICQKRRCREAKTKGEDTKKFHAVFPCSYDRVGSARALKVKSRRAIKCVLFVVNINQSENETRFPM